MKTALHMLITIYIWHLTTFSQATDPNQLQDFCVAVNNSLASVFVNGRICKNPNMVTAHDFFLSGLNKPGNTSNPLGSKVTPVFVAQLAGLNTLGISLVRIDYAPQGINPPQMHPRATEILVVVKGTLYVGFVTSNLRWPIQFYKLFTKTLFVFPQGLIHFQYNIEKTIVVIFAGQSSQNLGFLAIANALFNSNPRIKPDVLAKSFWVKNNVIEELQAQILPENI